MRDYSKILLQRTGRILWDPVERFITIGGGLVGILVIFNQPLMDWLVATYQGIPWWIGLLILEVLLMQAVFRAGYALWKDEEQARKKAEDEAEELRAEIMRLQQVTAAAQKPSGPRIDFIDSTAEGVGTFLSAPADSGIQMESKGSNFVTSDASLSTEHLARTRLSNTKLSRYHLRTGM